MGWVTRQVPLQDGHASGFISPARDGRILPDLHCLPLAGVWLPENLPGTSVSLNQIGGVAVDAAGNVFLSLPQYSAVMRLDAATGILTRIAGNGTNGFSGDNGPAVNAQLNGPNGLALDPAGNLYIADSNNNRIRKVTNGTIATIAGNGGYGPSGDGGCTPGRIEQRRLPRAVRRGIRAREQRRAQGEPPEHLRIILDDRAYARCDRVGLGDPSFARCARHRRKSASECRRDRNHCCGRWLILPSTKV